MINKGSIKNPVILRLKDLATLDKKSCMGTICMTTVWSGIDWQTGWVLGIHTSLITAHLGGVHCILALWAVHLGSLENPTASPGRGENRAQSLNDLSKVTQLDKGRVGARILAPSQDAPFPGDPVVRETGPHLKQCLRWCWLWSYFNYKSSLETNEGIKAVILG